MKNTDRAAKVMHEHNLFYFTSGDGWHEPREESAECRCGAEFFDQIQPYIDERDPDALYRAHLAEAMNKDGCLMPDLPEKDESLGVWDGKVTDAITHVTDGKVYLEWGGRSNGGLLELDRDEAHEIALLLLAASQ